MNGKGHRPVGVLAHLAVTPAVVAQPPWWTLGGCVAAMAAAAGPCSPDCDQSPVLGGLTGGHRHATHTPELAAVLSPLVAHALPPVLAAPIIAAWWSHIAVDLAYNGIPIPTLSLLLRLVGIRRRFWHRYGGRLKTGGLVETGQAETRRWILFGRHVRRQVLPVAPAPLAATVASLYLLASLFGLLPGLHAAVERLQAL